MGIPTRRQGDRSYATGVRDSRAYLHLLTHLNVVDVPKPVVEEKSRTMIWIGQGAGRPAVVVDTEGNHYNPEDCPELEPNAAEIVTVEDPAAESMEADYAPVDGPAPAADLHDEVTDEQSDSR